MCERIRPLFELKQQDARLFDRGPEIFCVNQRVNPVEDLQASSLSPRHPQRIQRRW
ncbi:msl9071 (plasmid) [Mesorhizobium japonicum MAFF 303099]|uniref:Msl9071 protein n=1 Tax=Mesorhizobium japonicum (strain LMG 29417 / CECT 9101 / MAFF 303099) TaxID=266835 RepID=Q982H4_RHILO|nr:msl9071 [Mesorhizobium japonicum MAFF 303099]